MISEGSENIRLVPVNWVNRASEQCPACKAKIAICYGQLLTDVKINPRRVIGEVFLHEDDTDCQRHFNRPSGEPHESDSDH